MRLSSQAGLGAMLLVLAGFSPPGFAQETTFSLGYDRRTPSSRQIDVTMLVTPASGRLGGYAQACHPTDG